MFYKSTKDGKLVVSFVVSGSTEVRSGYVERIEDPYRMTDINLAAGQKFDGTQILVDSVWFKVFNVSVVPAKIVIWIFPPQYRSSEYDLSQGKVLTGITDLAFFSTVVKNLGQTNKCFQNLATGALVNYEEAVKLLS